MAITGPEQKVLYLKQINILKKKIANNPLPQCFSYVVGWSIILRIVDSSKIACRTVINLCQDRPQGEDPFKWINRKYAEDKNWHKGVKSIYNGVNK